MNTPNILYIHSHDTGRYIQPYGHAIPTPNLQRLAEQGVLFRQAFCAGPTCSPSRSALLTGSYPHCNGMFGLSHFGFGWSLNDYGQHLVHTLQQAGYFCALSGVQHVDGPTEDISTYAQRIGYDTVLDQTDKVNPFGSDVAQTRAAEFLRDAPQQPFFLSVGFLETHRGFPDPGPKDNPNFVQPPAPIPDTTETRRDMAGFITLARTLDRKMGEVLDALDESGLAETTLVICTTDHGIAFPRMKCNLTDHGTGVMLILRGPGGFEGGKAVDAMVSHMDIFPTLCELTGIDKPDWLQGASLLPLVDGTADEVHDALFSEVTYHAAYEPRRAIRTKRWKYIRRFGGYPHPVLPNCDGGLTKDLWLAQGWRDHTLDEEQLYDLFFDPNEAHNLADSEEHAPIKAGLQQRLQTWMEETEDPILDGPIPLCDGCRAAPVTGHSASEAE